MSEPSNPIEQPDVRSNNTLLTILLVVVIIVFIAVAAVLVIKARSKASVPISDQTTTRETANTTSHEPAQNNGSTKTTPSGTSASNVVSSTSNIANPVSTGGVIQFKPEAGTYLNNVKITLSFQPMKSEKNETILSDIFYTLDGSEPSRTHGIKYSQNKAIFLTRQGSNTLKAGLFAKLGNYQALASPRVYYIRPNDEAQTSTPATTQPTAITPAINTPTQNTTAQNPITPPQNQGNYSLQPTQNSNTSSATNLNQLDTQSQTEINAKTEKITVDIPGITSYKKETVKMRISISSLGDARLLDITGLSVEPPDKLAEIKTLLDQKLKSAGFPPPTVDGNMVDIKIWLEFKKISKFKDKIIFEK